MCPRQQEPFYARYIDFCMTNTGNLRRLLDAIGKVVHGSQVSTEDKYRVSAALFNISLQHANAIVVLIDSGLTSSAFALVRPMFETYVRASWIFNCAQGVVIERLVSEDEFNESLPSMLRDLDNVRNLKGYLAHFKTNLSGLHSYTHGGLRVIAQNITEKDIVQAFPDSEVVNMLKFASVISFLSFTGISELTGILNKETIQELYSLIES